MATEMEKNYYQNLYVIADTDHDGKISGQEALVFLKKTKLPDQVLKQIWDLVDVNKQGYLLPKEFAIAMRLISQAQNNQPVSMSTLAQVNALPTFEGIPNPQNLSVTFDEVVKYDELFLQADANHDGFVDGMEAKNFFAKSNLQQEQLKEIWSLADTTRAGKLGKIQFRIAIHLVYHVLKGLSLPPSLSSSFLQQVEVSTPTNAPVFTGGLSAFVNVNGILQQNSNFGEIIWKITCSGASGTATFQAVISCNQNDCKWSHVFENKSKQVEKRTGTCLMNAKQRVEFFNQIKEWADAVDDTRSFSAPFAVPFQADAESYDKKSIMWPQGSWQEQIVLQLPCPSEMQPRHIVLKFDPDNKAPPKDITKLRTTLKTIKFHVDTFTKSTAE